MARTGHKMWVTAAAACLGALVLAGCRTGSASPKQAPSPAESQQEETTAAPDATDPVVDDAAAGWESTPLAVASSPVSVKEGVPPLVYLVESPGAFRVRDLTGRRDLAQTVARARTILRVDARAGVVAGGETLLPGPLPADHRYAIYLDPTGPNMSRQGVFQPRPMAPGRSTIRPEARE